MSELALGSPDAPADAAAAPAARRALVALRDGDARFADGDAAAALGLYAQALDAARASGDAALESRACTRLGDARRAGGDHDGAIAALNGALKAARRHGAPRAVAAAHRELSLACEAAERFEPALVHFKAWHALEVERLRTERRQAREALRAVLGDDASGAAASGFVSSGFVSSGFAPDGFGDDPGGSTVVAGARAAASEPAPADALPFAPIRLEPMPEAPPEPSAADPRSEGALAPDAIPVALPIDALTLLGNAAAGAEALQRAIADPRNDVALVAIDLDHLASVNATFAPACGDDVLRRVGLVLLEQLKAGDAAFRVEGDRFHVVLHGGSARTAAAVAERLRHAIALHPWHEVQRGLAVTASAGVAVARPGADDAELLEQRARHALRAAKDGGRDRTAIDEP